MASAKARHSENEKSKMLNFPRKVCGGKSGAFVFVVNLTGNEANHRKWSRLTQIELAKRKEEIISVEKLTASCWLLAAFAASNSFR